jgi:MFS transporter, PPP family, 3-phenylpropionic acid transporter
MPAQASTFRFSFVMLFLFLGLGVQLPFLPLWLAGVGLGTNDIAAVLAGQIAARILGAPAGTFLADRYGRPVALIRLFSLLCSVFYLLLAFMDGFAAIFIVAFFASLFFAPVTPLIESYTIEICAMHGLDYGRLRVWASVGFIVATFAAGALLEYWPVSTVVFMIAAGQGLLALAAFVMPQTNGPVKIEEKQAMTGLVDVVSLMRQSVFIIFLLAVSFGQSSHAIYYSFASLHWERLGHSEVVIGILWAIGVVTEVAFFYFSSSVTRRYAAEWLILVGCSCGLLRWMAMAFDPGLALLAPLQMLHAASFALTHLGALLFIQRQVRASLRHSAQGVYTALSAGLFMMIATAAAGPAYRAFAGQSYFAMAALSLCAVVLSVILCRITPKAPAGEDA